MDFATVTPSESKRQTGQSEGGLKAREVRTLCDLWATKGLLNDDIAALWSKSDTDGVSKDVDTLEDASATLVGELDLFVGAASEEGLRPGSLGGGATQRASRVV